MGDPDRPADGPARRGAGPSTADAKVLRAFLDDDGRLVRLPARRGKRIVVLDHLARVFEPGVRYPELEVNALMRAFGDDVALLRRSLVDEGFLSREAGRYWRTGGTVELPGEDRDDLDDPDDPEDSGESGNSQDDG